MNTGSFFTIGSTHLVCEDYALHGKDYVILSDGCSNGGGPRIHTDWGSRILCKAAEEHIQLLEFDELNENPTWPNIDAFFNRVIGTASAQVASYPNLDPRCLTATLAIAYQTKGQILAIMYGDGVMGAKFKNGDWCMQEISFPKSAPYYLKYELNPTDKQQYFKEYGGIKNIQYWGGSNFEKITQKEIDIRNLPYEYCVFDSSDVEFVFISSDGLSSFYEQEINSTSKLNKRLDLIEPLKLLLDFRNFQPGFVERQYQWTFKTNREGSFGKKGWINGDDVSLGVIYCGG